MVNKEVIYVYCNKCGNVIQESSEFCHYCGNKFNNEEMKSARAPVRHTIPKCTCCGYVGEWKKEPVLRTMDIIIGLFLLIIGVIPGIVYIGVVALIRSNENNRGKICPSCKSKNLWTFLY